MSARPSGPRKGTNTLTAPTHHHAAPEAVGDARRRPGPLREALEPGELEAAALRYLNRFDASEHKLTQVLGRFLAKTLTPHAQAQARSLLEPLLQRYRENGLIDDQRLALAYATSLRRRGTSLRAIQQKLGLKGLAPEAIASATAALGSEGASGDLAAARAFVRRRKLGPHRGSDEERQRFQRKDLAALARRGFTFEVAKQALASDDDGVF
jgi:regulatory protein